MELALSIIVGIICGIPVGFIFGISKTGWKESFNRKFKSEFLTLFYKYKPPPTHCALAGLFGFIIIFGSFALLAFLIKKIDMDSEITFGFARSA